MNNRAIPVFLALSLSLMWIPTVFAQDDRGLVVIDLRPAEEKEGHGLTPLPGKCNEKVFRIADVASDPMKVALLTEDLDSVLGHTGKTLAVLNWSIYYNQQVRNSGSRLDGVSIQGYGIPGKKKERQAGSRCSKQESAGGWYQASELTSVYFPLISEFEGTFGGKPLSVRVVYSPNAKLPGKFEGDGADVEALVATVRRTAEALVEAIGP